MYNMDTNINDLTNDINAFPTNPSVNHASFYSYTSPATEQYSEAGPSSIPAPRPRSRVTGTRRHISPESLLPLDAPVQPRRYITPSATSRKDAPASYSTKRTFLEAFGDEEDELVEEAPSPNASEKEHIEWKRRQNTLAARKSRRRKLEYQQNLEDMVKRLTYESNLWKTRALTLQQMLRGCGVDSPDFND